MYPEVRQSFSGCFYFPQMLSQNAFAIWNFHNGNGSITMAVQRNRLRSTFVFPATIASGKKHFQVLLLHSSTFNLKIFAQNPALKIQ